MSLLLKDIAFGWQYCLSKCIGLYAWRNDKCLYITVTIFSSSEAFRKMAIMVFTVVVFSGFFVYPFTLPSVSAAKIDGTSGNDNLNGGNGNDNGGDDDIKSGNKADTNDGGAGDDTIDSGAGDDLNDGGADRDIINSEAGDDTNMGGDGNDDITSSDGEDYNEGGAGADTIDSGAADDTNLGGAGEDRVYGGKGKDTMTDFQPGQDKISILKPTVDTSSVGKNREKRSVGKNKHKSGK